MTSIAADVQQVSQEQAQRTAEEYARKLESRVSSVQDGFQTLIQQLQTVLDNIESSSQGKAQPFSTHPESIMSAMEAAIKPYRKAWDEQKVVKSLTGSSSLFNGQSQRR